MIRLMSLTELRGEQRRTRPTQSGWDPGSRQPVAPLLCCVKVGQRRGAGSGYDLQRSKYGSPKGYHFLELPEMFPNDPTTRT